MLFQEGNIIRLITTEGDGEIVRVLEDSDTNGITHVATGNDDSSKYIDGADYELVTNNQKTHQTAAPIVSDEHSIAIMNFSGAIKRESKRICARLSKIEDASTFDFKIAIKGKLTGEDVKITYTICTDYEVDVEGADIEAVLDEYMRRKGWKEVNQVKRVTFSDIPF